MQMIETRSLKGKHLTIKFGWTTEDEIVWLDGDKVAIPAKNFHLETTIEGVGQVEMPRLETKATDFTRELGINRNDTAIITGQIVYQGKLRRVEVQIDDETYAAIKAEQDKGKEPEDADEIITHPGYCNKCHSYCYGDCEAN